MDECAGSQGLMKADELQGLSRPTFLQRAELKKQQLEKQLTQVNEAIELMKKNPDIERLLSLSQNVLY